MPVEESISLRISEHPQRPSESGDSCSECALPVSDAVLNVRLFAPAKSINCTALVPAARALADAQARLLRKRLVAAGETVPCKAGCSSCCRYLIPLSVVEALRLAEELSTMPAQNRKAFALAFNRAGRRINAAGRPPTERGLEAVSDWYANLGLACPLLQDDLCSIYHARPLACREFMVTFAAELCGRGDAGACSPATPSVSIAEALARLAAEVDDEPMQSVMLPLAPAWALRNARRREHTRPAPWLAERLAGILASLATRTAAGGCAAA